MERKILYDADAWERADSSDFLSFRWCGLVDMHYPPAPPTPPPPTLELSNPEAPPHPIAKPPEVIRQWKTGTEEHGSMDSPTWKFTELCMYISAGIILLVLVDMHLF